MNGSDTTSTRRRSVLKGIGSVAAAAAVGVPMTGSSLAAHDEAAYRGVRVNQVGYPIGGTKIAIATSQAMDVGSHSTFELVDADGDVVHDGALEGAVADEHGTDHTVAWADFTDFDEPGEYRVIVGDEESHPFAIGEASDLYAPLLRDVGRLYTLKRSNTRIEDPYTGLEYGPGHTQDEAAIVADPIGDWLDEYDPGDTVSVPNGWYDAGDYGKYVNPAGITVAQLLLAYERNPDAFHVGQFYVDDVVDDADLGDLPDLLVECKHELRFLQQMQRPNGSLFYKLAAPEWPDDDAAPEDDDQDRYVFGTASAGTAHACGAFAMAARVYEDHRPDFAAEMLECAEAAWAWLEDNPDLVWEESQVEVDGEVFHQNDGSGGYGRNGFDEPDRFWAAAELLRTTGDPGYDDYIQRTDLGFTADGGTVDDLPGDIEAPIDWNNPVSLGHYAYFWADGDLAGEGTDAHTEDGTAAAGLNGPYWIAQQYLGNPAADVHDPWTTGVHGFYWGWLKSGLSRAVQGRWAVEMHQELGNDWIAEEDEADVLMEPLHHVLGRSPTGYSFVTGHGEKSTENPHDRIVQSQGMDDPVPGMLVGGPHNTDSLEDEGDETLKHIDEETPHLMAYYDDHGSFATNEWAINYTAPLLMALAEMVDAIDETPEPETDDTSDTIAINGYEAQDTTGDGLYDDITGDGETTHEDVTAFFEHLDGDAVQGDADSFDFAGDGGAGFTDVISLFERM